MTHLFGYFKRATAYATKASWLFMSALLATASQAQVADVEKQHWYTGTLEGRTLFLRVFEGRRPYPLEDLEGVSAQYFFQDEGKWVTLRARADGWLEECAVQYHGRIECKAEGIVWRSEPGEDGALNLTRRRATESVSTLVPMRALASDAESPLCEIPQLQQGPRQTMGGISFAWVKDPRSGVKALLLLGGLPEVKLRAFNEERERELKQWSCQELEFMLPYGGGTENEMTVQFASRKYLSVGGLTCGYSGGTSGNCIYDVVTYDLTASKAIQAEALFKRASDLISSTDKGGFPLQLSGSPRNLDELVWQLVKNQVRRWPWPMDQGGRPLWLENDPENSLRDDWFDRASTCEWDDSAQVDQDKPKRCWLNKSASDSTTFAALLTNKGLTILFTYKHNVESLLIPWRQALAVLKPGIRLH